MPEEYTGLHCPGDVKPPRAARRSLPVVARTRWSPELPRWRWPRGSAEGPPAPPRSRGSGGAVAAPGRRGRSGRRRAPPGLAIVREPPPALPIACGPGCPSCCVSKVAVVAPEVIRIAAHLSETPRMPRPSPRSPPGCAPPTPADEGLLPRRARARAGVLLPAARGGRRLLGRSTPSARSSAPRWTSLDASACERHFADPDGTPAAQAFAVRLRSLANAVLAGLGRAALDAGRDGALPGAHGGAAWDRPGSPGRRRRAGTRGGRCSRRRGTVRWGDW